MLLSCGGKAVDAPALLQLRKLGAPQLDLSEFQEAFISPTRELLILLSYQYEALLLPLITDDLISRNDLNGCYPECHQGLSSSVLASGRPDSLDNVPCTSESVEVNADNGFSPESTSSRSKHYPFVFDVKSLAWGHCGDAYDQHKDISVRELLLISGDHGITVHAFRCLDRNNRSTKSIPDHMVQQGRWVEWGPMTIPRTQENEHSNLCDGDSGDVWHVNSTIKTEEIPHEFNDAGLNESSTGDFTSKNWLRTFLSEVETIESEGKFSTRFPKNSSIPCSAEIVSFSIWDSTSVLLDFLAQSNSVSDIKENWSAATVLIGSANDAPLHSNLSSLNSVASSDNVSKVLSSGTSSFKCSRVFSSSSHRLVGLVMTLGDPTEVNNNEENVRTRNKIFVIIAMIYQWGIQWISSVKLQDMYLNPGPEVVWTDFQFSNDFLICLTNSGLISVYGVTTGKFVKRLDILQICGIDRKPNYPKPEKSSDEDDLVLSRVDLETKCEKNDDRTHEVEGYVCTTKRIFKSLIVASGDSFLAAVDKYGVVYLIFPDDYISDQTSSVHKLLPNSKHLGISMSVGYEVGGIEIGCQRVPSGLTKYHPLNISSMSNMSSTGDAHSRGPNSSSFIVAQHSAVPSSKLLLNQVRRIFLPIDGCGKNDSISFSPLGITRFIRTFNINGEKGFKIVHTHLHVASEVQDDRGLESRSTNIGFEVKGAFTGDSIGCFFQGCLYLVTHDSLSVVLPSVAVSSNAVDVESVGYWRPSLSTGRGYQIENFLTIKKPKILSPPWKIEVLDRILIYEGPEEADNICLVNGWDPTIARLRHLQLALDYMKADDIQQSLELLVEVNLAEEGILRLLFTAVHRIFCKVNDNEVTLASRLLTLAASFAIKVVRKYALLQHNKGRCNDSIVTYVAPKFSNKAVSEISYSRRLREMAHFLEVIRNLQCRLNAKCRRPSQGLVDDSDALSIVDTKLVVDDSHLPSLRNDAGSSSDIQSQHVLALPASELAFDGIENLALMPVESLRPLGLVNFEELSIVSSQDGIEGRKIVPMENPKAMMTRWEIDKLDLRTVVKDALHSGRLPLAVLQLHLQRLKNLVTEEEPHDIFNEVRDVGRAIAYDLFLKGEIGLAIATLQRLGEDIEINLKQLLFGTVRRSLRLQLVEEMQRYGFLTSYEWKILDRISLIERLYPSSSFSQTFRGQHEELNEVSSSSSFPEENKLQLMFSHSFNDCVIECSEIDGVVIGPWATITGSSAFPLVDEDTTHVGYWAAAAVWSDAWDQRTIDRVVLDRPLHMGVHVSWESQLEYHICHNDWDEVSKLLDIIPSPLLSEGSLQISLDGLNSAANVGCRPGYPDYEKYICSSEELESVCMNIPNIKLLKSSASNMCSMWLRIRMEEILAKKFIFLKEYWEGTAEIISLLSRSGFIINKCGSSVPAESSNNLSDAGFSNFGGESHRDTEQAFHKLLIHHCARYDLPNLLDLYLDHHKLVLDNESLISLQDATGDCEWAKWLLLSRVKGREYDASFSNARSIMSHNLLPDGNVNAIEVDEIIRTIDDMAERGSEMAALATLIYSSESIQKCLCSGSVNRHISSSTQCTLENLRPALQRFPTLWRTLVAACFGQDVNGSLLGPNAKSVFGNSALSDYLNWRENIFTSSGCDTSVLQMLPCWFSKTIRRLVQLFVQGPFGWQSIAGISGGDLEFFVNTRENAEISAVSWEGAIQKSVEGELYASSIKESGVGVEHHLHRGRALAAFNYLLAARVQNLKSGNTHQKQSGASNIQADVQLLLAPLAQSEQSLLSSVVPLAIMHFEDSVLVASCAFLLELCGLSASMLRVDIAALRRISSFYDSSEHTEHMNHLSPKSSAFHAVSHEGEVAVSLARALAEDYLQRGSPSINHKETSNSMSASKRPSRALIAVLQHLEKVSLPLLVDGKSCGSWLFDGSGDGTEIRSRQKSSSQHWNLVTSFCQMHDMPLSTKYLAVLARDNDWVGFLTEAQVGGYPFDMIIQVASKEFSDARLKIHILTVLKSMHLTRKKASSSSNFTSTGRSNEMDFSAGNNSMIPVELFGLLADCEKQKNPGEALLLKAKDLRWSLLAMIASCFLDVTSLTCLTVWLEITAARETSSIKVNDLESQIANNIGAAVRSTNSLSADSRTLTFRYNRRNAKRRRLIEPTSGKSLVATSNNSGISGFAEIPVGQEFTIEDDRRKQADEEVKVLSDPDEGLVSLSKMVGVLCEQRLFLPLLRAFEMFLPSCLLLPFIRALQAFSQMRLSEASAHLASFSARIKEEPLYAKTNTSRDGQVDSLWISATAVGAADALLSTCPSAYEKRCLLQLLAATDFGDGGSAATCFRRLYWKINLAEPSLRKDDDLYLGNETLDDASLLTALEKNGHWDQARNWARQLEASGGPWKSAVHHVTETQAEAMVAEWKEYLWDVPEERAALWGHCQTLFLRYSFPALQAGLFFLNNAETVEKEVPAQELHEMLLLSLQWLSGIITQSNPVYPLHLLREIETRVWLLAVESEAEEKSGGFTLSNSGHILMSGNSSSIIERTAGIITKMDNHLNIMRNRALEKSDARDTSLHTRNIQTVDASLPATTGGSIKAKRRAKIYQTSRRPLLETVEKNNDPDDGSSSPVSSRNNIELYKSSTLQEDNVKLEMSLSRWEESVGAEELERAVLSLLEFGQVTAAQQLQQKLSPELVPSEFLLVDAALKLAAISTPSCNEVSLSMLDEEVISVIQSYNIIIEDHFGSPLQVLESLATKCTKDGGRGLCKRIIAVVKAANVLGIQFSEAFGKRPLELLQLLSLKAQDSFEEAKILVKTHSLPPASIAQILAESFLKGLLAAHRGGYMDSQKEEGPAPLLWRISDFLKWAELCPSEPEIGHALMRLVITGQEIPHACEVELLILSHHFYKSSACLDGVDVLVALAATRVDSYVSEGDFSCLARLVIGVSNFHALNFILGILIENGQLELLLQKYSAADTATGTAETVRGFRMAVLTSLKHFNPHDVDAFAMVYNHFDMKHEMAALLESRAMQSIQQWFLSYDREQNEDLLESMHYFIKAGEVHSTIDAGNKTRRACAQASLLSLQIRMPDFDWLNLSMTNARRALVEQSRFQEALIVAEAYNLNQPSEWALVLWNQMLKPELTEQFVAEFVAVLPLQPSMLADIAKFYRAEVAARVDHSNFSMWLSPAEWLKHLARSFRCLLKRTRDLRLRLQLATVATGFGDMVETCVKALDRVPDTAGPLVLRKGHGGAYLPLM